VQHVSFGKWQTAAMVFCCAMSLFERGDPTVARMEFLTLLLYYIAFTIAAAVIADALRPKPEIEDAKPSPLGDFKFPTATEQRRVPVIFGTVKIEGPNVLWYGDFRSVAIKQKVKTGLFSSKRVIKAYKYFVGLQMGLCQGRVDTLRRVWIGDRLVFDGALKHGEAFEINLPYLYGGNDTGTGGVQGSFRFFDGRLDQDASTYLSQFQSGAAGCAYRGTAYVVWEGGYIGNSTQVQPWSFEVERFPNSLGLPAGKHRVDSNDPGQSGDNAVDSNPMEVLYEVLTSKELLNIPAPVINTQNFLSVGETLFDEGYGFSAVVERPSEGENIISYLMELIDGVTREDKLTGLIEVKLVRNDYSIGSVPAISNSNLISITDESRQSWQETTNEFRVAYTNRGNEYKDTYASDHDIANQQMQGDQRVSTEKRYFGCLAEGLALRIAARELRLLSYPLVKVTFIVNREFYNVLPGDVVSWTDADREYENLAMRVVATEEKSLVSGEIRLTCFQDIFSVETDFFGQSGGTNWSFPFQEAQRVSPYHVVEAPRAVLRRDLIGLDSNLNPVDGRLWAGGARQSSEITIDVFARHDSPANIGNQAFSGAGSVVGTYPIAYVDPIDYITTTSVDSSTSYHKMDLIIRVVPDSEANLATNEVTDNYRKKFIRFTELLDFFSAEPALDSSGQVIPYRYRSTETATIATDFTTLLKYGSEYLIPSGEFEIIAGPDDVSDPILGGVFLVKLYDVYRGALDTSRREHIFQTGQNGGPNFDPPYVEFIGSAMGVTDQSFPYGDEINVRLISATRDDRLPFAEAVADNADGGAGSGSIDFRSFGRSLAPVPVKTILFQTDRDIPHSGGSNPSSVMPSGAVELLPTSYTSGNYALLPEAGADPGIRFWGAGRRPQNPTNQIDALDPAVDDTTDQLANTEYKVELITTPVNDLAGSDVPLENAVGGVGTGFKPSFFDWVSNGWSTSLGGFEFTGAEIFDYHVQHDTAGDNFFNMWPIDPSIALGSESSYPFGLLYEPYRILVRVWSRTPVPNSQTVPPEYYYSPYPTEHRFWFNHQFSQIAGSGTPTGGSGPSSFLGRRGPNQSTLTMPVSAGNTLYWTATSGGQISTSNQSNTNLGTLQYQLNSGTYTDLPTQPGTGVEQIHSGSLSVTSSGVIRFRHDYNSLIGHDPFLLSIKVGGRRFFAIFHD